MELHEELENILFIYLFLGLGGSQNTDLFWMVIPEGFRTFVIKVWNLKINCIPFQRPLSHNSLEQA